MPPVTEGEREFVSRLSLPARQVDVRVRESGRKSERMQTSRVKEGRRERKGTRVAQEGDRQRERERES